MVSKEKTDLIRLAEKNKGKLYETIYRELVRKYILTSKTKTNGSDDNVALEEQREFIIGNIVNYDYPSLTYKGMSSEKLTEMLKDHINYYGENIVFIEDNGTYIPAAIPYTDAIPHSNSNLQIGFKNHVLVVYTSLKEIRELMQDAMEKEVKNITKPNPIIKETTAKDTISIDDFQRKSRENINIILRTILQEVHERYDNECVVSLSFLQHGNYDAIIDSDVRSLIEKSPSSDETKKDSSNNDKVRIETSDFIANYNDGDWIFIRFPSKDGKNYTYYPVLRREFMRSLELLKCKCRVEGSSYNDSLFSIYITIDPNKLTKSMANMMHTKK